MTTTHRITFTEESLTSALNLVHGLHELSTDLIAGDVFRMSSTTVGHDSRTPAGGVTDSDIDRLVETAACLVTYAEDEAAATCDDEENSEKAWDAADKAHALLEEITRKRSEAQPSNGSPTAAKLEHGLDQAEGVQPDLNIQHVADPCAATAAGRRKDEAKGDQPDLNFHLLQLAERSCSLLEDWLQATDTRDSPLTEQIRETRALLESLQPTWSIAAYDILAERRRQIYVEGHTASRDDQHEQGQLADAAASYTFFAWSYRHTRTTPLKTPSIWPWGPEHWKPSGQRQMLLKAGALILAELERLDRQAARKAHSNAKGTAQ